jgi:hypothetical protein
MKAALTARQRADQMAHPTAGRTADSKGAKTAGAMDVQRAACSAASKVSMMAANWAD